MPYIKQKDRDRVLEGDIRTEGELNYFLTTWMLKYIHDKGASYSVFNGTIGVLECAKQELYRRMVSKYEDEKIAEHGDVVGFEL